MSACSMNRFGGMGEGHKKPCVHTLKTGIVVWGRITRSSSTLSFPQNKYLKYEQNNWKYKEEKKKNRIKGLVIKSVVKQA